VKPKLCADEPSQVRSWDIDKLRGSTQGVYFHLYVLIDIYSRFNPGWIVSTVENTTCGRLPGRCDPHLSGLRETSGRYGCTV
jgi:hypothetical protein